MKHLLIITFALFTLPAVASTISVPSDPGVKYTVIHHASIASATVVATMRVSNYGTSFSSRMFNCSLGTYKYLADVDGANNSAAFMAEHNAAMDNLSLSGMSPVSHGSITYYIYQFACKG